MDDLIKKRAAKPRFFAPASRNLRAPMRVFSLSISMFRQFYDALRYAIADFFDVPYLGVAALLTAVLFLIAGAYVRTIYGVSSRSVLQWALIAGAWITLLAAGNHLKKR